MSKNNSIKVPVMEPIRDKMKEMVQQLPGNWATLIGNKLGVTDECIRQHYRGDRGRRDKLFTLQIYRAMKDLLNELKVEIENAINEDAISGR